jgi:transposase-like protein
MQFSSNKAVELAGALGNVSEIAAELGINTDVFYRWRSELKAFCSGCF